MDLYMNEGTPVGAGTEWLERRLRCWTICRLYQRPVAARSRELNQMCLIARSWVLCMTRVQGFDFIMCLFAVAC